MTLEEKAEQFADNISGLELTCSLLSAKDKSHAYRLGRYDGFLAGLKAGLKMKVNTTTISDAPLMEKEQLEQAKEVMRSAIDALYSGGTDTEMMDRCEEILKQFLEEE